VVESNGKVANDLGILSSDPFGAGWLMKVKLSAPLPADLLTRAEYEAHFKQHH
jgi:glycine cleavage system H protein